MDGLISGGGGEAQKWDFTVSIKQLKILVGQNRNVIPHYKSKSQIKLARDMV